MKMPRSQNESENVQFVQELAEVDGPFEAPININFRNLIKLELPSLVWNRGDTCPKKMKITNTGHTVIISGKWKCERPYLSGGPLCGKYVFSQIHFHWGQDDCGGSEHQICGEGFPLEMHVTHFKTEYLTQECALREKDGMVVVVYLFKLQEEPNDSLKKIINSLAYVKQSSTSYGIDPRPILTLCNPFTDDYFMYWGSVVTSTCAHILLWLICREPFGISREQVSEFRKIMDSYHQPICKNSRDIQPLHKRNVFHVNASKHMDEPLLPIKKILGCYCKGGEDNAQQSAGCSCQAHWTNQEDVEERYANMKNYNQSYEGEQVSQLASGSPHACYAKQTFFVQNALVPPLTMRLKRSGSDPLGNYCCFDNLKKIKSEGAKQDDNTKQVKLVTQSCCFLPEKEVKKIKSLSEKRKTRERKRPFNSLKAFTQIMHSLEVLKNHTFKKLKEIESINQEIKDVKPYCQDTEDKTWIRKIEKIMTRQKRFTIKSSQGCLHELKKLAKDCNFFDAKALPVGDHNQRLTWLNNGGFPGYDQYMKGEEITELKTQISKHLELKFSSEAQKLIQSFFEDIKDSEDIQNGVKKDLSMKKIKSIACKQENSLTIIGETKGLITQKMFILGNLGTRFFAEVMTDSEKQTKEFLAVTHEKDKKTENEKPITKALLPINKTCVALGISKTTIETEAPTVEPSKVSLKDKEKPPSQELIKILNPETEKYPNKDEFYVGDKKETKNDRYHWSGVHSSSNISIELTKAEFIITESKKSEEFWKQKNKKFGVATKSSKRLYKKTSSRKFTNSSKRNKRKSFHRKSSQGSTSSKEEGEKKLRKSIWKKITRTKIKKQMEGSSDSTSECGVENAIISPKRKKLKLDKFGGENVLELKAPRLKYLERTLSYEYQTHESRLSKFSTTSTNRTRPSSVDSIFAKHKNAKYALPSAKNLIKEIPSFTPIKHKNKSVTILAKKVAESMDDKKSNKKDTTKVLEEMHKATKFTAASSGTSIETYNYDIPKTEEINKQEQKTEVQEIEQPVESPKVKQTMQKNSTPKDEEVNEEKPKKLSEETLHSDAKSKNRKRKKSSLCCKRSSKHVFKKNPLKKHQKSENKLLNFLDLTDEEQLKIISVNVAKYLKQKLAEETEETEKTEKKSTNPAKHPLETGVALKEPEKNINKPETPTLAEKVVETPVIEDKEKPTTPIPPPVVKAETKPKKIPVFKPELLTEDKNKKPGSAKEPKSIKTLDETRKTSLPIARPKSSSNFIKMNKQLAGRHKRLMQPVVNKTTVKEKEKKEKEKEISPRKDAIKPKGKTNDVKKTGVKTANETKTSKVEPNDAKQTAKVSKIKHLKKKQIEKVKSEAPPSAGGQKPPDKSVKNLNKTEAKTKKPKKKTTPVDEKKPEEANTNATPEKENPEGKEKSEENKNGELGLPEIADLIEPNVKPETSKETNVLDINTSEATFKKELEYFIKLQMCLDSEISSSIENPTKFDTGKDLEKNNPIERPIDLLQYLDLNKKIILLDTENRLDPSISYSVVEKPDNYTIVKESGNKTAEKVKKDTITVTTPMAETETKRNDGYDESNSESNYDCKISITLNATPDTNKPDNENFGLYDCLRQQTNSQTTYLEGSSSQSTISKLCLKTDSDIPLEMKKKLLELFEGEIKRKVGMSYVNSSGNSSNGFDESDGNNKSTESSSDNIEVLAQFSSTMKQYLEYLKEKKKLTDKDKEFLESADV